MPSSSVTVASSNLLSASAIIDMPWTPRDAPLYSGQRDILASFSLFVDGSASSTCPIEGFQPHGIGMGAKLTSFVDPGGETFGAGFHATISAMKPPTQF